MLNEVSSQALSSNVTRLRFSSLCKRQLQFDRYRFNLSAGRTSVVRLPREIQHERHKHVQEVRLHQLQDDNKVLNPCLTIEITFELQVI